MAVLSEEQLEELAASLRNTSDTLEEALLEMGLEIRSAVYCQIEDQLAVSADLERCGHCGRWTDADLLTTVDDDESDIVLCPTCAAQSEEDDEAEDDMIFFDDVMSLDDDDDEDF